MKPMTIRELCRYLAQFDPDTHIWIVYDGFDIHAPEFEKIDREYGKEIVTGDLVDWEG